MPSNGQPTNNDVKIELIKSLKEFAIEALRIISTNKGNK